MGEFVTGFDELATLTRGISIFGSARTHADDPDYAAAQETAALLARAGFAVITGGGPESWKQRTAARLKRAVCRLAATSNCRLNKTPILI